MNVNLPKVDYELIRLVGGLDQITPTLSLPPGMVRRAANFECSLNGGYTRIGGYERFDGQPNPSDARYNILQLDAVGAVVVGNAVIGSSTAATGKVIAIDGTDVIITREVGTYIAGENLLVGATVVSRSLPAAWANTGGASPVRPNSKLPAASASNSCGPAGKSSHLISVPGKIFSNAPCCLRMTRLTADFW